MFCLIADVQKIPERTQNREGYKIPCAQFSTTAV